MERLQGGESARRSDILQILIDSQRAKDTEDRLTAEAIATETVLYLVAGSETTSGSSGFVMIELLRHPDKLAKLQHELDTQLGATFNHDDVKHLPYLNAVINEAMRLNFIGAGGLERVATQDCVLAGKVFVPKGVSRHAISQEKKNQKTKKRQQMSEHRRA